jgi:hypothetical protein
MTLTKRVPTHAVTGPGAWENGRDTTSVPTGPPQLHGTAAAACLPGGDCT